MNKGFTLAEVLITLGIIGVVSALTMPQLIANYQKRQTIVQFKKVYSTLSQGFLRASQDIDLVSLGNNWQNRDEVMETLSKYFNVTEKYTTAIASKNYAMDSFCMNPQNPVGFPKKHRGIGYRWLKQDKIATGMTTPISHQPSFVLQDGACVGFSYFFQRLVIVDINGNPKGPNRMGYDLFFFQIDSNGNFKPFIRWETASPAQIDAWCTKQGEQIDEYCAAKILKDGFEINYW